MKQTKRYETDKKEGFHGKRKGNDLRKHYALYLMLLFPVLYYLVFCYLPMGGLVMAFQDYNVQKGLSGSEWVGFGVFRKVLRSAKFWRAFGNTLRLNLLCLVVGFPAPILLALLLNELRESFFRKTMQTILYLPHFISWVMIGGMAVLFFATEGGMVNTLLAHLGMGKIPFLTQPGLWIGTYVGISVWQSIGWGAIIYLSAMAGIDQEQYEAARMDGAGDFKILCRVVLPVSKPVLATVALFYAVARWNALQDALLYINDPNKKVLQICLKQMIQTTEGINEITAEMEVRPVLQTVRAGALIFSLVPVLVVYPFLQKYFVKGTTIGSVKG